MISQVSLNRPQIYFGGSDIGAMASTLSSLKSSKKKGSKDEDEEKPIEKSCKIYTQVSDKLPEDSALKKVTKFVEPVVIFVAATIGALGVLGSATRLGLVPSIIKFAKGTVEKSVIPAGEKLAQKTDLGFVDKMKKSIATPISTEYNKLLVEAESKTKAAPDAADKAKALEKVTGDFLNSIFDRINLVIAAGAGLSAVIVKRNHDKKAKKEAEKSETQYYYVDNSEEDGSSEATEGEDEGEE